MAFARRQVFLVAILLFAAFLRLAWLGAADVISDEALHGFRSIGYVDYLAAPDQPTTWERLSWPVPWWAYLSFHDHPPLTFLAQHFSFRLFGVTPFALRLPSALVGILSVWLAYLIVQRLWGERFGLLAAALFAVVTPLVWVSRLGLQEALVILWGLLAVYGYVRAGEAWSRKQEVGEPVNRSHTSYSLLHTSPADTRWYLLVGLALGLGLLTKYTIIAVALALLAHLLWFRRTHLRSVWLWWGGGVFVFCALPLVVYNLMLYRATGHFDLQLSFLLGQEVAEWRTLPGKAQIGSFGQRLADFVANLGGSFSLLAIVGLLACLVTLGWQIARRRDERDILVTLLVVVWALMLLVIGPSTRFLAPLAAWLVLAVAGALAGALQRSAPVRTSLAAIVVAVVAGEALFAANTVLVVRPVGAAGFAYAQKLRTDVEHWGYRQLDEELGRTLAGKRPALTPDVTLPFLKVLQARAAWAAERRGDVATPLLIVYDANLYNLGALWTLHRRLIYDGWPVVTADRYLSRSAADWKLAGVREVLFIRLGPGMLGEPFSRQSDAADRLAASEAVSLATQGQIVSPKLGTPAFTLYQWRL